MIILVSSWIASNCFKLLQTPSVLQKCLISNSRLDNRLDISNGCAVVHCRTSVTHFLHWHPSNSKGHHQHKHLATPSGGPSSAHLQLLTCNPPRLLVQWCSHVQDIIEAMSWQIHLRLDKVMEREWSTYLQHQSVCLLNRTGKHCCHTFVYGKGIEETAD